MIDQVDWDGALTHRIGKVHEVGLFNLKRQADGTLARQATALVKQYAEIIRAGEEKVGNLDLIVVPSDTEDQGPPIGVEFRWRWRRTVWPDRHWWNYRQPLPVMASPTETATGTAMATAA